MSRKARQGGGREGDRADQGTDWGASGLEDPERNYDRPVKYREPVPRRADPSYLGPDRPPRHLRARVMSSGDTQIIVPMQLP